MRFAIKRGRDIRLPGAPAQVVREARQVSSVALTGNDYPELQPSFDVEVGDYVAAGQTLFVDRKRPQIAFVSPASGRVEVVTRGRRRTLDSVVVKIDGDTSKTFDPPSRTDDKTIRAFLLGSGMWPAFRCRPFERIPDPETVPQAIFVTAIDTSPLGADAAVIVKPMSELFQAGLDVIRHLTPGPIFVCQAPGSELAEADDRLKIVQFGGPHPAGLPGTHIHHLMPAGRDRHVWHIGYQDIAAIGHLFTTGTIWTKRIVSLAGSAVREPGLVRTYIGADLDDLVSGELHSGEATVLSGSPISGRPSHFLGRYHTQVTALGQHQTWWKRALDGPIAELFGSIQSRPIIPISAYDAVMPLDILVVPLLRALAVGDADTAERLGCLELAEDDMALLTHICPTKADYGLLLRRVLDRIEKEM